MSSTSDHALLFAARDANLPLMGHLLAAGADLHHHNHAGETTHFWQEQHALLKGQP